MRKFLGVGICVLSLLAVLGWRTSIVSARELAVSSYSTSAVLHVDASLAGQDQHLNLFDAKVRLAWDANDVRIPANVTVYAATSSAFVRWSRSDALTATGVWFGFSLDALNAIRYPVVTSTLVVNPTFSATSTRVGTSSSTAPATSTMANPRWERLELEARKPFGAWHMVTSTWQDGFIQTRVGAEMEVRATWAPIGLRSGSASWYSYKKCRCAASPDFPKGTPILVRLHRDPTKWTVVRVNDWGPDRRLYPTRVIDLDAPAFKELAPLSEGMLTVDIEPLAPTDSRVQSADKPLPPDPKTAVKKKAPVKKTQP